MALNMCCWAEMLNTFRIAVFIALSSRVQLMKTAISRRILYYSSLDGNWNTDGDGYWAEIGEDDLLPDVSVARFPCQHSLHSCKGYCIKPLLYQDAPVLGEIRNILIAGEELWTDPLTYGEDYLELLIGYHEDNGYATDGMYEDYELHTSFTIHRHTGMGMT